MATSAPQDETDRQLLRMANGVRVALQSTPAPIGQGRRRAVGFRGKARLYYYPPAPGTDRLKRRSCSFRTSASAGRTSSTSARASRSPSSWREWRAVLPLLTGVCSAPRTATWAWRCHRRTSSRLGSAGARTPRREAGHGFRVLHGRPHDSLGAGAPPGPACQELPRRGVGPIDFTSESSRELPTRRTCLNVDSHRRDVRPDARRVRPRRVQDAEPHGGHREVRRRCCENLWNRMAAAATRR